MYHNMSLIKLEKITNGTFWLQIDSVELRMLCGCPADAIKFLIKKGYIQELVENNQKKIIGPNALLLSDKHIQNGRVSNFGEFPILHMFYVQGMLVPSSPNYGLTPYMIGSSEMIENQLKYLITGNYGLTDQHELDTCYSSKKLANDMMEAKLYFASGGFVGYSDILHKIRLEDQEVKNLKGDAKIKRLKPNVFQVSFRDETVELDLNLNSGETYGKTFSAKKFTVPEATFSVSNFGNGDGWSPEQPCFSSLMVMDGKKFLIDAGPNLNYILDACGMSPDDIDGIFQTHIHDDHFCGYETLWQRKKPLKVYLAEPVRRGIRKKLTSALYTTIEEVDRRYEFVVLPFDSWIGVDNFEVQTLISPHSVETSVFIFRRRHGNGFKSYAHFGDLISFRVLDSITTKDGGSLKVSEETARMVRENYLRPADFKKIDIGGGMIHGDAIDFIKDTSTLKSLGHINRHLTTEEMKMGIFEPFGATQILIP